MLNNSFLKILSTYYYEISYTKKLMNREEWTGKFILQNQIADLQSSEKRSYNS